MSYAEVPEWTTEQRGQWIADYNAGRPVLLPWAEHDAGECTVCDMLRDLADEADEADREVERDR
jgi:hypothetical protein